MDKKLTMDRRRFITNVAGVAVLGAAAGLAGCAPQEATPAAASGDGKAGAGAAVPEETDW